MDGAAIIRNNHKRMRKATRSILSTIALRAANGGVHFGQLSSSGSSFSIVSDYGFDDQAIEV
jgi:hypothetical protein